MKDDRRYSGDGLREEVARLVASRQLTSAKAVCQRACERNENDSVVWTLLGVINLQLGFQMEAEQACLRAISIDAKAIQARMMLASALIQQGKTAGAKEQLKEIIRAEPGSVEAHLYLANLLQEEGVTDEAIAHYREIVRIDPSLVQAWFQLGNLFYARFAYQDAINCYREALNRQPYFVHAIMNMGVALVSLGEFDGAIDAYQQALSLRPNDPVIHYNAGEALIKQNRFHEAISYLNEALRLKENFSAAGMSLSIAAYRLSANSKMPWPVTFKHCRSILGALLHTITWESVCLMMRHLVRQKLPSKRQRVSHRIMASVSAITGLCWQSKAKQKPQNNAGNMQGLKHRLRNISLNPTDMQSNAPTLYVSLAPPVIH